MEKKTVVEILEMTKRFKFTIAYDGTAYYGWQVQPDNTSVQQVIEKELAGITHQDDAELVLGAPGIKLQGSGRTNRGVHVQGQAAHVGLECRMSPFSLMRTLNS